MIPALRGDTKNPRGAAGRSDWPDSAEARQEPIVILLIDDDSDCRGLVRDAITLGRTPSAVFEVGDGEEAMDFLYRRRRWTNAPRPALIFLDLEMPGRGGQETLRRIRSDRAFRDIPVVMMTGVSDESQMLQAAENGANSYTIKPADAELFLQTVSNATDYWLKIHQHPSRRPPRDACRK